MSELRREAGDQPGSTQRGVTGWAAAHAAGLVALAIGLVGLAAAAWLQFGGQRELLQLPEPMLTIPVLVATAAAAIVSFARRERAYALPLGGVGCAVAALALGWFLLVGAVTLATLLVILIMHQVM